MRIVHRAIGLIGNPAAEWRSIAVQPTSLGEIMRYVLILAAIPPLAAFVGYSLIGVSLGVLSPQLRMPIGWGISRALAGYGLWVGGVYVTALVIEALAPRFQSRASFLDGLKLAGYAPTAAWLAGIFLLIPPLGALALVGLYSVYVLAVGLPIVARCPPDEAPWFTAVIVACSLIVGAIALLVVAGL
jgi:hypothetical protein